MLQDNTLRSWIYSARSLNEIQTDYIPSVYLFERPLLFSLPSNHESSKTDIPNEIDLHVFISETVVFIEELNVIRILELKSKNSSFQAEVYSIL